MAAFQWGIWEATDNGWGWVGGGGGCKQMWGQESSMWLCADRQDMGQPHSSPSRTSMKLPLRKMCTAKPRSATSLVMEYYGATEHRGSRVESCRAQAKWVLTGLLRGAACPGTRLSPYTYARDFFSVPLSLPSTHCLQADTCTRQQPRPRRGHECMCLRGLTKQDSCIPFRGKSPPS